MALVVSPGRPGSSPDQTQTASVDSGLSNAGGGGRDSLKNALREGVTSSTHNQPDYYERKDYTRDSSKLGPDERDNAQGYAPSSSYKRFVNSPLF